MVYIRLPSFKTGIAPSNATRFNTEVYTATQKMWLARNRIWGNVIGGNERSGYKELKKQLQGPARAQYYKFHDLRFIYPFVNNWEAINDKKMKFQERRQRIFMRGVKIGAKKGGGSNFGMSVFEMKDKKKAADPAGAQKINEDAVKSGLSDESLGLSSDA